MSRGTSEGGSTPFARMQEPEPGQEPAPWRSPVYFLRTSRNTRIALRWLAVIVALGVAAGLASQNLSATWFLASFVALVAQPSHLCCGNNILSNLWMGAALIGVASNVYELGTTGMRPDPFYEALGACFFCLVFFPLRESYREDPDFTQVEKPRRRTSRCCGKLCSCLCSFCSACFGSCFILTALVSVVMLFLVPRSFADGTHYYCYGDVKKDTVIFLHPGLAGSIGLFGHLMPKLGKVTRTCSVNPPGIGWSVESTAMAKDDATRFLNVIKTEYFQLGLDPKKAHTMLIGHSRGLSISHYLREFSSNLGTMRERTYDVGIDGFPSTNWAPASDPPDYMKWFFGGGGDTTESLSARVSQRSLASVIYVFRGYLSLLWPPFQRLNLGGLDSAGDLPYSRLVEVMDASMRGNYFRTVPRQSVELSDWKNFPQRGTYLPVWPYERNITELREMETPVDAPEIEGIRLAWNVRTVQVEPVAGKNVTHTGIITFQAESDVVADWMAVLLHAFRDLGYFWEPAQSMVAES